MWATHGWPHEAQQYNTEHLDILVVVLGAALIAGIVVKHIWRNLR